MNKIHIILICLGTIGCILLVLGYLIKFKHKIQLIAGVSKNDDRIKDKKALGGCPRIAIFSQIEAFEKFYRRHIVNIPRIKFCK